MRVNNRDSQASTDLRSADAVTRSAKQQLASQALNEAADKGDSLTIVVNKGHAEVRDSFLDRLGTRMITGIGFGFIFVLLLIILNECFGLVRVKGRTPLSLIRND